MEVSKSQASLAAEGWGGDRYVLYQSSEGGRLLVLRILWDTDGDGLEFFDTFASFTEGRNNGREQLVDEGEFSRLWVGSGQAIYLEQDMEKTLLIFAPDATIIEEITGLVYDFLQMLSQVS